MTFPHRYKLTRKGLTQIVCTQEDREREREKKNLTGQSKIVLNLTLIFGDGESISIGQFGGGAFSHKTFSKASNFIRFMYETVKIFTKNYP